MMPSQPPSVSTGASGQGNRITASLVQPSGHPLFQLTFRGETIPLVDSGSLNRWAAIGVVDRHKISMLSDGVSIDGRKVAYSDPQATTDLERILNRPEAPHHHSPAGTVGAHGHSAAPTLSASEASALASLIDSVRVSRDGFEYHVTYRTRFGENKTEKLADALEAFQRMRIFKPHVGLQKSGIRLVVTCWDGENFVEQPGIENLEHVTPEQVEALIRANLHGGPEVGTAAVSGHQAAPRPRVTRIEVVKKQHDARFHLVYHLANGRTEEGPLLIRPNMAKLGSSGLFAPDVSISMSAMNDRIVVGFSKPTGEGAGQQPEIFALNTRDEAKVVEAALNRYLRTDEPPLPAWTPAPMTAAPAPMPVVTPDSVAPAAEPPPPPKPPQAVAPPPSPPPAKPAATDVAPTSPPAADEKEKAKPAAKQWVLAALRMAETMAPEEINPKVFDAVRARFHQPVAENEYGFPEFAFTSGSKDGGSIEVRMVLAPHYLLCAYPFGYLRFGAETRVFLSRLDDYIAFPQHALRGVGELESRIGFVVTEPFCEFLRRHGDRNFRMQFGDLLLGADQLAALQDLVWPTSPEEQLFQSLSDTARSYGLPVTAESIVLDPNATQFIGFKKVAPHAMEFREGEDFVRFTPEEVDLSEEGQEQCIAASGVLRGWALDNEGRVAALYRASSGFVPPEQTQLLRFISEDKRQEEPLNILAELGG